MADTMREKVSKLHDSRTKAEAELNKIQQKLIDAIENAERRVRVDRLVTSCEEALTKAFAKNEHPGASQQINQPRVSKSRLGEVVELSCCQK